MYKILKIFLLSSLLLIFSLNVFGEEINNGNMFKAGISLTENVSTMFFGTWRVSSNLIETNSPSNFKTKNIDIWDLAKDKNTITLSNPFSGAKASVDLTYADGNTIKFSKKTNYDNKNLIDIVEISVENDTFTGTNNITLETLSDVDGSVIKKANATYQLRGDKISGKSIGEGR